jgi:PKD repeat protein
VEDADIGTPVSVSRTVTVGFLGPKVPVPSFKFSPASPGQFDQVVFDATATTLDGDPCSANCRFDFDFGDGASATGQIVAHRYNTRGSFNAILTVTSVADGTVATKVETVTVGDPAALTASFTFSPTDPLVGDIVIVNANSSTTPDGATIVSYDWDFGCQTADTPTCTVPTASGVTASTVYNFDRTYTVRLTITDSVGRTATTTKTILVKDVAP